MTFETFFTRLLISVVLGLLLGLDREIKSAPVGVRTFALVSMGAAVYTMLTLQLGELSAQKDDLAVDPSRLIQGLIGGIGFLGAGAIIGGISEDKVRGIATGAAIWVAGGVGVACGLGLYWQALGVAIITAALLVLTELAQAKWGSRDSVYRQDGD